MKKQLKLTIGFVDRTEELEKFLEASEKGLLDFLNKLSAKDLADLNHWVHSVTDQRLSEGEIGYTKAPECICKEFWKFNFVPESEKDNGAVSFVIDWMLLLLLTIIINGGEVVEGMRKYKSLSGMEWFLYIKNPEEILKRFPRLTSFFIYLCSRHKFFTQNYAERLIKTGKFSYLLTIPELFKDLKETDRGSIFFLKRLVCSMPLFVFDEYGKLYSTDTWKKDNNEVAFKVITEGIIKVYINEAARAFNIYTFRRHLEFILQNQKYITDERIVELISECEEAYEEMKKFNQNNGYIIQELNLEPFEEFLLILGRYLCPSDPSWDPAQLFPKSFLYISMKK